MTADIRWGIIGPGRIAAAVVPDFAYVPGAVVTAAASRSAARAQEFADRFSLPAAYGSYRALIDAPDIDAVYIATPHPQHRQIAVAALRAGKAVLVEKAFTATVAGAEDIATVARSERVFAMEAMWTRFQPAIVAARELIADGAIGEVRQVQAQLGVDRPYIESDRLYDLAQGGGALLDLGVYVVSLAQHFLGSPDSLQVTGSLAPTRVDWEFGLLLGYADGRAASLLGSLRHHTPGAALLLGTNGWIEIPPRFHHPDRIVLHRRGREPEVLTRPALGVGYAHEFIEVGECLRSGRLESAVMPLSDSIAVQQILNGAAERLGVVHRDDDEVGV